jgi:hypothetical protein
MKIEGYIEITEEEYLKFLKNEASDLAFFYDANTTETYRFKKVQKVPIVFEDETRTIKVYKNGIEIKDKINNEGVYCDYDESFPLLVKAVKKAQEVKK